MQSVITVLSVATSVLALALPVAFYLGAKYGRETTLSEADRVERFASGALETLKASSLTEKVQAESLRGRDEVFRKQLIESFNAELTRVKQEAAEELEVVAADGTKRKVRAGDLEPLSPVEVRNLERIS